MESVQKPVAAASQVHQILRTAILQSQFRPGEKLIETRLAADLGVSRTPIREALSKLEAEGLVAQARHGGVIVQDVEPELVEIYGIRQRLESYAGALAAERRTEVELAEIQRVCELQVSLQGDDVLDERVELNNQFHILITEASHSRRLIRHASDYRDYFLNRQFALFYDQESVDWQRQQHQEITDALRRQDAKEVERLIWDHFQRASNIIQRGLMQRRPKEQ